jgi:uncharacterized protein YndB with AHSA1/START domain
MVEFAESVIINAPPEQVWAWLSDLPRHYREWHPAHVECRYIRGDHLTVGAVLLVVERLHGKQHRLQLRATEVVPNRLLRYASRGFRGAFELKPTDDGTSFTASLEFGWRVPLIGAVIDRVLRLMLMRRLAAFHRHLKEEGRNLKRLLESRGARETP